MFVAIFIATTALLAPSSRPPPPARADVAVAPLRGVLRHAGRRAPIDGAQVLVIPDDTHLRTDTPLSPHDHVDTSREPEWIRSTTTDTEGSFTLGDLPEGRVRIIVALPGYARLEQIQDLPRAHKRPLVLFVRDAPDSAYRTVVRAPPAPKRARVTSRLLSPEEIATLPGTQGDSLRALQNLPGVARAPGGLGLLVLRGASPNQSQVFYGEHALPNAFHAIAVASVVPTSAVDGVEFLPSNAPSRYGELTGGVVVLEPRRPRRDGVHGFGKLDLTGASAVVEGPLGKGAFLVGANRGWIDGVVKLVDTVAPESAFTVPRYYDYQALVGVAAGGGSRIDVRVLGSSDKLLARYYDPEQEELQTPLEIQTQFHRVDLVYTRRRAGWRLLMSPSFRIESNRETLQSGPVSSNRRRTDAVTSWRAEAEHSLSRRASFVIGVDAEIRPFWANTSITIRNFAQDPGQTSNASVRGLQTTSGAYLTTDLRLRSVSLYPGLRLSAYTLGSDAEAAFDPRFAGRWRASDAVSWGFGVGLYSQSAVQQRLTQADLINDQAEGLVGRVVLPASIAALEPRSGFAPINNDIGVARAAQASTGVEVAVGSAWTLDATVYGRLRGNRDGSRVLFVDNRAINALTPHTYGLAYGLEVLARRQPVRKLYGWLAYTLSRSERRFFDALGGNPRPQNGVFDQRHILTLVASYVLPKGWRVGGRFRVISGSPFTTVVGTITNTSQQSATALLGARNAARFPVFHQLDLRVDRKWVAQRVTTTLYVDVQNVYNRRNVEAYLYDDLYRSRFESVGLPIFPTVGFRIDY